MRTLRSTASVPVPPLVLAAAITAIGIPVAVGTISAPRLLAQASAAANQPAFDAISIKRNTGGMQGGTSQFTPGRFSATNISLRLLIRNAYGVMESQLIGGPQLATSDFLSAEKFDIEATFPANTPRDTRDAMYRTMLTDRFKVVTHRETRDLPVYVLVKARPDGRLGPALQSKTSDACAPEPAGRPGGAGPAGVTGPQRNGTLQFGPGSFIAKCARLTMLVDSLANRTPLTGIDRPVLDRTDLAGPFDFELKWTPAGRQGGPAPLADDPDRPSLFTALQEQLGLKLEPERAPIEVLVIDSAGMPDEN